MLPNSEDVEDAESLEKLFHIMQGFVMLGESSLYQVMFEHDTMLKVIGGLEYDPALADGKAGYRAYIEDAVAFKEVVAFNSKELREKVHQTFRISYLKDVILHAIIDDHVQNCLSSYVLFNGCEIAEKLQEDPAFAKQLVANLKVHAGCAPEAVQPAQDYKDHVGLLKEYCNLGKTLHHEPKTVLFKTLVNLGIFEVLGAWLRGTDVALMRAAVEILLHYLQHHTDSVRQAIIDKHKANKVSGGPAASHRSTVLQDIVHCFTTVQSKGLLMQTINMIRKLLNSDDMDVTKAVDKSRLLTIFYDECMDTVMAPLDVETVPPLAENLAPHERLVHVLELLSFTVPMHTYHIKNYVMRQGVIAKVNRVIASPHMVLKLAALRLLRTIIGLKNEFYNRHLIKIGIFGPVVAGLVQNGPKNNLVFSCTLEILEFIRKENIQSLVAHVAEAHEPALTGYTFASTPRELVSRHAMNKEAAEDRGVQDEAAGAEAVLGAKAGLASRFRRDTSMDEEEENYFDDDEDEEDKASATSPAGPASASAAEAAGTAATRVGGAGAAAEPAPAGSGTAKPKAAPAPQRPTFKRLVDYDDDEDGSGNPFPDQLTGGLAKRAKFPGSLSKNNSKNLISFKIGDAKPADASA